MTDTCGDALNRSRALIDDIDSGLKGYKALDSLWHAVYLLALQGEGLLAPAGAKMMSSGDLLEIAKRYSTQSTGLDQTTGQEMVEDSDLNLPGAKDKKGYL